MQVRKPAVSGQFYPSDPAELSRLIDECYVHRLGPGRLPPAPPTEADIVAVVSPHAGYIYSGPVAAHSYYHVSSLRRPDLAVVVAPNHYGVGSGVATFDEGGWDTPLGRMPVDGHAAAELVELAGIVSVDPGAHRLEHSLEVQLPFLQRIYGDTLPLLPISLLFQDIGTAETIASALTKLLKGKRAVLVASSDLTHYEAQAAAKEKDMALLREVLKMDVDGFYSTLEGLNVTACGYGAIATVMLTAKAMGLTRTELLKYATSGDTSGDNVQVVGYGALRFVSN
ncbi:MAG: AmmeMemoRadiSam system protein B [Nitrososphaerota archaeon]|jgi:AmmeMemoRadiSam system protein B|nr:AmmeMemoRadiSam system protein B [Nitrososphaerota archaeon]MDG6942126.1 AmmeMemoRadiSam system protein B [Nitrososphaerota archaeon]MDG6942591.1 AmmeMemoRadiSam system protein B [Nitrososphaerota archaeon]MDG6948378.1 AmmeMemoRadiSam system protein B [Nitrososphaerota archaeon]MDG6950304.1 AmmeMemoRadiSam system protein B [Nitrososphaerota archaeon]